MKVNCCDYDYYQDMRKFFRRSISLVMAIAVYTYLAEIVEAILNKETEAVLADRRYDVTPCCHSVDLPM
jgi:hypothetical protein